MKKYAVTAALLAAFVVRAQDADVTNLIRSAEQAARRGQYSEADGLYAKAAAGADSQAIKPALWYLGTRAAGLNNRLAAQGFFERLLRIDPKGPYAARSLTWMANLRTDDP